jgi:glycosyltransferase involved in cell wall biosynthesis
MTDESTRRLRVLEIETYGRGGLMHYTYNLGTALAKRGLSVDLLTAHGCEMSGQPLPQGMRLTEVVGRYGARLDERWPAPLARLGRKAEVLADARAVAREARRLRPDIIHLHNTNTSAIAYLSTLSRLGIPLIATAHVVTPHERIVLQNPIYRRIHQIPDRLIAHSNVDRKRLQQEFGIDAGNVTVIPHGDYGFFAELGATPDRAMARARLGLDEHAPVALFFGYVREYKGLDVLLKAWPDVTTSIPDARLVIAGDPERLTAERRETLQREADAVGAVHRFEYIPMDEVATYFAAADLLVLPYRHISQSGVLYLALSLGIPVVASAVGAWTEMLSDEQNALLVEPGSESELAAALRRALRDPEFRTQLAAGGRQLAEAHSWAAVAEKTERMFRDLLAH